MNKGLVKQLAVLIGVTGLIIICGIFLPRFFITRGINKTSELQESVLENEVSPYGEEVVDRENKIRTSMSYFDYVVNNSALRERYATAATDPEIDDKLQFVESLIDVISSQSGHYIHPVRYRTLLTGDSVITHIAELYDGTLDSPYRFLMEEDTGIVLLADLQYISYVFPEVTQLDEVVNLYEDYLGVNFVEIDKDSSTHYDEYGIVTDGAYTIRVLSIDGNLSLRIVTCWNTSEAVGYNYWTRILLTYADSYTSQEEELEWIASGI